MDLHCYIAPRSPLDTGTGTGIGPGDKRENLTEDSNRMAWQGLVTAPVGDQILSFTLSAAQAVQGWGKIG